MKPLTEDVVVGWLEFASPVVDKVGRLRHVLSHLGRVWEVAEEVSVGVLGPSHEEPALRAIALIPGTWSEPYVDGSTQTLDPREACDVQGEVEDLVVGEVLVVGV